MVYLIGLIFLRVQKVNSYSHDIIDFNRHDLANEVLAHRSLGACLSELKTTRIQEEFSKTELNVESDVVSIVNGTENLVVCAYHTRDLDRLLSFYNAAVKCNRDLVIDLKQAYLLKLFQIDVRGYTPHRTIKD